MKIKNQCDIGRLVGKIDNDFNISESDWIPRVAAWTIDALSQMKVLPMERKKRQLEVKNRTAYFPCKINGTELKVFDAFGCEIPSVSEIKSCCGKVIQQSPDQMAVIDTTNTTGRNYMKIVDIPPRKEGRNYVLDCNKIDLNFDTDFIFVESYEVATYYDDYYDCECPYIYDNGTLLEALAWYCLFKYLSRGSKHPVYDLKSQNPAINPFMQWMSLKSKAAASVKVDIAKDKHGWNNFFYNSTFLPRN